MNAFTRRSSKTPGTWYAIVIMTRKEATAGEAEAFAEWCKERSYDPVLTEDEDLIASLNGLTDAQAVEFTLRWC